MASFRMALLLFVKRTAEEAIETKIRSTAPSAGRETSPNKAKKSSKMVVGRPNPHLNLPFQDSLYTRVDKDQLNVIGTRRVTKLQDDCTWICIATIQYIQFQAPSCVLFTVAPLILH